MNNSDVIPADPVRTPLQQVIAAICAVGGVLRDIVYVTIDALRGRYDH